MLREHFLMQQIAIWNSIVIWFGPSVFDHSSPETMIYDLVLVTLLTG